MPRSLQSITPLRGIAALFVVFHHYSAYLLPELGKEVALYTPLWLNSYLWVDFFFVLSGFLLAHVYGDRFKGLALPVYITFLTARFARIYPLHIFMLILFVGFELLCEVLLAIKPVQPGSGLAYNTFTDKHSVPALFGNILLLQGIMQGTSWNQPSRSISTEWIVYLLFPLLAFSVGSSRLAGYFFIYIALLSGLYVLIEHTGGHLDLYGWPALLRALLEFMIGMVLYGFLRSGIRVRIFRSQWVLGFAIFATFLLLHLDLHDTVVIPFLSLLILAASQCRGPLADGLNSRPLVWLGDISYSIYMTHWFLYIVCTRLWLHWAQTPFGEGLSFLESSAVLVVSIAILLAFSNLTYRKIEVPARYSIRNSRALARLSTRPEP